MTRVTTDSIAGDDRDTERAGLCSCSGQCACAIAVVGECYSIGKQSDNRHTWDGIAGCSNSKRATLIKSESDYVGACNRGSFLHRQSKVLIAVWINAIEGG